MQENVIITCAVTGSTMDAVHKNPHVPVTPRQIADECLAARDAGAAIVHIHVRDPETGEPSMELSLYEEVVERIRSSGSDVLINLTTGPGARYRPDHNDTMRASADSTMSSPAKRVEHVLKLKPDLCSIDVVTMSFPTYAFVNIPSHVEEMLTLVQQAGVKPELEIFDMGHARLAASLVERGIVQGPSLFQLCMGIRWSAPASVEALLAMKALLPANARWSAFGISWHQYPIAAHAMILGGHIRVGLEDNIYISRGKVAEGNAPLVSRAATLIEALGARAATPAQARELLSLSQG